MTWTLRFFEEDGTEIAVVERPDRDTLDVTVIHSDPKYEKLGKYLRMKETVADPDFEYGEWPEGWVVEEGPELIKLPPKRHLERVREGTAYDGIDSTTLKDE